MKYFWLIFSVFIFVLAISPCCGDENQAVSASVSSIIEDPDHNEHSHAHDVCSPFCTCASCGAHACSADPFQAILIGSLVPSFSEDKVNTWSFEFPSKFEVTIWQPPRLS